MQLRITKLRRGVSLTELMVLMSATTMILSMSAMLLHRVMRVQVESRAFADAERNAARLSRQFRQDAHQAASAVLDASKLNEGVFLRLQLPANETIEYSRASGNILRAVSHGGKIASREEFPFQPACKMVAREEKSPDRLILVITSPALDPASSQEEQLRSYRTAPVALQVEAMLNRGATAANSKIESEQAK
jgi:hypothetical protein